jgi:hypothetical protein
MADESYLDIPAFLREQGSKSAQTFEPSDRAALLRSLLASHQRGEPLPTTLAELCRNHPLPPNVVEALRQVVASTGKDESLILKVFLSLLAEDSASKGLDPAFRSAMRGSILGSRAHRGLRSVLVAAIFK